MLLLEISCNTDPNVILTNIAAHIKGENVRLQDCHSSTGNAIKSGELADTDRIVVLGHGTIGTHSIIVDADGNIKVDSYQQRIQTYDPKTLAASYYTTADQNPKAVWKLVPVKVISVQEFKQNYL